MNESIGVIAGSGKLPELMAREARKKGYKIAACAIKGETDEGVDGWADRVEWIRLGELGRLIRFFKREGVREAVMGGKITKTDLFKGEVRPDLEMVKLLATAGNHSDDSLLGAIADYLDKQSISVLDSTVFLSEETLPQKGVLSKRKPTREEMEDVEFGWRLAKEIAGLDIGQTVVVKKKAILAVEAIEGTDEAILRGGALGRGKATVVKVAKPRQDMRFDVPAIGLGTLEALIKSKARALAFEAGKTIFLDRRNFLEKADRHGIAVLAKES